MRAYNAFEYRESLKKWSPIVRNSLIYIENMVYRFLGNTGMKVSVIGFGNMTFDLARPEDEENCFQCFSKYFNL